MFDFTTTQSSSTPILFIIQPFSKFCNASNDPRHKLKPLNLEVYLIR